MFRQFKVTSTYRTYLGTWYKQEKALPLKGSFALWSQLKIQKDQQNPSRLVYFQSGMVQQLVVDATKNDGPIKYSGLGFVFGVDGPGGLDCPVQYLKDVGIAIAATQQRMSEQSPFSGLSVYRKMREAGLKHNMVIRLNDLCTGYDPYDWPGLQKWFDQIDYAISCCQEFKDILHSVAIFNEPDNRFWRKGHPETKFMSDPLIPQEGENTQTGGCCGLFKGAAVDKDRRNLYDNRVNWLWTQTFKRIKGRDPSIPICGPCYETYNPWRHPQTEDRMKNFLKNAMQTDTVPDYIAWHCFSSDPGDVSRQIGQFYRRLEEELKIPNRPLPVVIEEYGPNTHDVCGPPGSFIKYAAELERSHVDLGMMAIYGTGGLLGNTLRYNENKQLEANGGFWMLKWYRSLTGYLVSTSSFRSRYYSSFDGISAYDPESRTIQIIFGGSDDDCDVVVQGLHKLNFGPNVRARVETTVWDIPPGANPEEGGSIQRGVHEIYDKDFSVDANGQVIIPVHRIHKYDGYRVIVSPMGVQYGLDPFYPKYEAENMEYFGGRVHSGPHSAQASNHAYVAQLDQPDHYVKFYVDAPIKDNYYVNVRYAAGLQDSNHRVFINEKEVQRIQYARTNGWGDRQMDYATIKVALDQGTNLIKLQKGDGQADLDFMELQQEVITMQEKINNIYHTR